MTTTKKKLSLDEAYERLQEISRRFENSDLSLEQSIPLSKEALDLGKLIKKELGSVEKQVEEISAEFNALLEDTSE